MRKPTAFLLTFLMPFTMVLADATDDPSPGTQEAAEIPAAPEPQPESVPQPETPAEQPKDPIQAFTGKVNKNKVRIRAQASLESPIVKELNKGDVFIVVDETDDFYAIQPPVGTKGYVFRTFILDNVVEGNHVNVRLHPDVDSPVIAQLSGGDRVDGVISPHNNKWMEITPPATTQFYVAKEFVEKIGDTSVMAKLERRRDEVNLLLNSTSLTSQKEMGKDFPEINHDWIATNYNKVINSYADFPDQVSRARELLTKFEDDYMKKKIAYLEAKTKNTSQLSEQMKSQQDKLAQLEIQLQKEKTNKINTPGQSGNANTPPPAITDKMNAWQPIERAHYEAWTKENANGTQDEYYQQQKSQAVAIRGIVEPYTRLVKNKPGDYVLLNQANHQPVAFLYSTQVNLQNRVGQEVTVHAIPRPNNNFAYPAYFVVGIE